MSGVVRMMNLILPFDYVGCSLVHFFLHAFRVN